MNKNRRNLIYVVIFIVILFILSFFLIKDERKITKFEGNIKDLITFPLRIFSKNVTVEISSEVTDTMNSEMSNDLRELKSILDLNIVNSDFEYINSTIINRNSINWYDIVTIDKGLYQDVKKGMSVINKDGFVGEVIKVTNNTSEVKLITSPEFKNKISVMVSEQYGITTRYDLKKGVLLVDGIKDIDKVNIGDKVVTSGLTSLYPSGILIGKVSGKRKDEYKTLKYLEVKLNADIKNSHYLSVLKK